MKLRQDVLNEMAALFKAKAKIIGSNKKGDLDVSFFDLNGKSLQDSEKKRYYLENDIELSYRGRIISDELPNDTIEISKGDSCCSHNIKVSWNHDQIAGVSANISEKDEFDITLDVNLAAHDPGRITSIHLYITTFGYLLLGHKSDVIITTPEFEKIEDKITMMDIEDKRVPWSLYLDQLSGQLLQANKMRGITYNEYDEKKQSPILTISDDISTPDIVISSGYAKLSDPDGANLFQNKLVHSTLDVIESSIEFAIPGSMNFIRNLIPNYKVLTRDGLRIPQHFEETTRGVDEFKLPENAYLKQLIWVPNCMRRNDE